MSKTAAKSAKGPRVFVPLTKVDEEQRLVYGTITQQILDKSGEMMDYETSKPNFEKWSNEIHEASGGLSKGNLRVMHGLTVAGKLTDLEFNDDDQSIEVCSKVVDDAEWNKVLEGCYTGFSVGGRYGKKWTETIDGEKVTKFTAVPNEVSLVDNPCVPSATFQLVKADGAAEEIEFKVSDELRKNDGGDEEPKEKTGEDNEPSEEPEVDTAKDSKNVPDSSKPHPGSDIAKTDYEPSNSEVAEKAGELAKAANDGSTWMQHIEAAREELIKAHKATGDESKSAKKEGGKGKKNSDKEAAAKQAKSGDDEDDGGDNKAAKADFSIANRLSQTWTCSDGTSFEKKADAEKHEATLVKTEPTEADKLRARLEKAEKVAAEPEPVDLLDDYDRLGKVYNALSTPFGEDGKPVLEKGMYTVERFARLLWDMGKLNKTIAKEGADENNDSEDKTVAADIKNAIKDLGESFKVYVADQLEELLAGIDDEAYVCYYDYYYAAAHSEGEDQLAKDVVSVLVDHKDSSRERREAMGEELSKAFGLVLGSVEETEEELSPPMQKRFDELTEQNQQLTKVATDAIEKVEQLAKRVQAMEDTPLPRAPGSFTALKEGDFAAFGKATTDADKAAALHDMLKTHGADGLATMMIKAVHASGGQQLNLAR